MSMTFSGSGTITGLVAGGLPDAVVTSSDLAANAVDSQTLTLFNASGSAPVYACRAWVTFNGSGTVAIQGSANVTSVVDNGSGNYSVNFTTAMPDNTWSGQVTCGGPNGSGSSFTYTGTVYNRATGGCGINAWASNGGVTLQDPEQVNFAMFR